MEETTIPLDKEISNRIADCGWTAEVNQGGQMQIDDVYEGVTTDDDAVPVGVTLGDGFTVLEEYRGFISDKVTERHVRLCPEIKDVFLYSDNHFYGLYGAGRANNMTPAFHEIYPSPFGQCDAYIVNCYRDGMPETTRQCYLREATDDSTILMEDGQVVVGKTYHRYLPDGDEEPDVPCGISYSTIFTEAMRYVFNPLCPEIVSTGAIQESVIGHELGHSVNMSHYAYTQEGPYTVMTTGIPPAIMCNRLPPTQYGVEQGEIRIAPCEGETGGCR